MKKASKYLLLFSVLLCPNIVFASKRVFCGNVDGIPQKIPQLTSFGITVLQVVTAVILVIMGTIDLFKGIATQKEDEIKKGQQSFVKRIITAALVFFVILIVKLLVGVIANSTTSNNIMSCMDCFLSNGCKDSTLTDEQSHYGVSPKKSNYKKITREKKKRTVIKKYSSETIKSRKSTTTTSSSKTSKKSNTIFVGDSRTVQMCESYKLCENNEYIAKVGEGYDWFVNTAVPNVNGKIKSKEYNIVILMGVNGVGQNSDHGKSSAEKYFNKVSSLAKDEWKKQNIIYVSINPVVDGKSYAYMAAINSFNSTMSSKISSSKLSNMSYCDTASKVKMSEIDSGDGLHYNKEGNSKIYNLIKNNCLK